MLNITAHIKAYAQESFIPSNHHFHIHSRIFWSHFNWAHSFQQAIIIPKLQGIVWIGLRRFFQGIREHYQWAKPL